MITNNARRKREIKSRIAIAKTAFSTQNGLKFKQDTSKVLTDMIWRFFGALIKYVWTVIKILGDQWVPVTTAWRTLRLRIEERPPIWRVAANIVNKHSRTANKGWYSILGVGP